MSAPLPDARRKRCQKYIEEGLSGRTAALRLKVSPATGARWAHQVRTTGRAKPTPQGPPRGKGKLAPHRALLEKLIAQDPDIKLFELCDALAEAEGVQVHHSSIANLLSRLGFTYKRVSGRHRVRRAKVTQQRADWLKHRRPAIATLPDRVVIILSRDIGTQCTAGQRTKPQ